MNDKYIKLEDAIKAIGETAYYKEDRQIVEDGAREALEELDAIEVSEDCISREYLRSKVYDADDDDLVVDWEDIANAPSVIPSRSRGEWIPCSEKLPKPETEVLVSFSDGTVNTLWQKWSLSEGINYPGEPLAYVKDDCIPITKEEWEEAKIYAVAWMPLPEAYKEA